MLLEGVNIHLKLISHRTLSEVKNLSNRKSLPAMARLNTILLTAFRVLALATLGFLISAMVHLELRVNSPNPKTSQEKTPSVPGGRDVSRNATTTKSDEIEKSVGEIIYAKPTEKRLTLEQFISIQCPSDGDFGDEVWKDLDCKKRLPSVLGIGFQRCGMSALNMFLSTHPVIKHVTPFQVAFWNQNKDKGVEWYLEKMPVSSKYQTTMETTSTYVFNEDVPKMISYVKPDMKFIALVCDPIVRAVSDFVHLTGTGTPEQYEERPQNAANEPHPFIAETFEKSVLGITTGDPLKNNTLLLHGQYELYLRKWLEYLPKENFLILDGTSFKDDPLPILQQIEGFLKIPSYFDEDKLYYDNYKGFFCRAKPSRVCATKRVGRHHPPIDEEVSRKLKNFYSKNNKDLKLLTGKNFTWA